MAKSHLKNYSLSLAIIEYYSDIKKDGNISFCYNMDNLGAIILYKISQTDKYSTISLTYGKP